MNTPRVLIPLAPGFEEIEAITVVDILRRAGIEVITAGLIDGPIEASRKTRHLADTTLEKVYHQDFDVIVLPGGQPGTNNLKGDQRIRECLLHHVRTGKLIAAICAAPIVLHELGILAEKQITSHPSVRDQLSGAHYLEERVVMDGKLLTSRGPGTAIEFAYKIVELLRGANLVTEINHGVMAKL